MSQKFFITDIVKVQTPDSAVMGMIIATKGKPRDKWEYSVELQDGSLQSGIPESAITLMWRPYSDVTPTPSPEESLRVEVIQKKRRGGKTTELIKRSARTGETIICLHSRDIYDIRNIAKHLGLDIPPPVSISTARSMNAPGGTKFPNGCIVDNADVALEELLGATVRAISVAGDTGKYRKITEEELRSDVDEFLGREHFKDFL